MRATERVIIREADLPDLRRVGARLRAGCPLHGSDHQRSLSIQAEGDYAGFGVCFACKAQVLVEDLNPDAARRFKATGEQVLTAQKLLRPVRRFEAEQTPFQKAEHAALSALDERMRRALSQSQRARDYLEARAIPLQIAQAQGLGYLPPAWKDRPEVRQLQKWVDRLLFPLSSPTGRGYIGRALYGWHPGMDENAHKGILDVEGAPRRWEKTYPAGWFGLADLQPDTEQIVLVEGPFDRLALIAAGASPGDVVALGSSGDSRIEWIPASVRRVVVALDGDEKGKEAGVSLAHRLYTAGLRVAVCAPPDDGLGKDWSERWRRGAHAAVWPVFEALDELAQGDTQASPAQRERKEVCFLPEWQQLPIRERLYRMAEALGYPAWPQGLIAEGDWRAWRRFAEGPARQVAEAYDALLPRFQR